MRPVAIAAMTKALASTGNPSSLHAAGRAARRTVEESREALALAFGARPSEVIFTSGGTESNNLALKGRYAACLADAPERRRLVIGATEHHAVLDVAEHLVAAVGAEVTWVEPDRSGVIPVAAFAEAIGGGSDVAIASIMVANNEVGAISDVRAMAGLARERGVLLHTDAVQAAGHIPVSFADFGVDLMTVTGHKLGGPVGAGALIVRRDVTLVPLTHGGGQERQVRSGTLDAVGAAGFAAAATEAVAGLAEESERVGRLRDALVAGAQGLGYGIEVNGAYAAGDVTHRLPHNVHLRVPGCEGDSLLYLLDAAGVECSTGSACHAGVPRPSHVLLAMGLTEEQARGALRLTLGHTSTAQDIEAVLTALPAAIERAQRAASGAHRKASA